MAPSTAARNSVEIDEAARTVSATRTFNAPRELVWKLWTDPEHVRHWWGPHGFTNTIQQMDVRPGGRWLFVMHGPDGTDYPNEITYKEVAPPERLSYSHGPAPKFDVTATFEENGGQTTVEMVMAFEAGMDYDGCASGLGQTLDRLGERLALESRSLSTTRVFDAPRELVWKMWTDPEHVKHWWGPRGFTNTINHMDVRPGGQWLFIMHGPDGTNYRNEITYTEVKELEYLSYSHGPSPKFDVTVTFTEQGDKTAVRMTSIFESAAILQKVIETFGADKGLHETLDRLGEQLANRNAFTISRTFDAPRELVFRVWTERDHLAQWFGPKGMTISHCTNDLRVGGLMHYAMRADNGFEMWGRWLYREITPPQKLVFVTSFSDPEGNVTRAPFGDEWPREMLTTITFDDEGGRTNVTVQSAAINATEEERKTFDSNHPSMRGGWTGTFDVLAEYLAKL